MCVQKVHLLIFYFVSVLLFLFFQNLFSIRDAHTHIYVYRKLNARNNLVHRNEKFDTAAIEQEKLYEEASQRNMLLKWKMRWDEMVE